MSCFGFLHIFSRKPSRSTKNKKGTENGDIATISNAASASLISSNPKQTILSRDIPPHRYEGGRQFHGNENIAYVLPNDVDEDDRLHLQHWSIKLAFGSNFDAPVQEALESGMNVLDSACGPATWTLEMANAFPRSEFYGTDISSRFPNDIKPGNCRFLVNNIVEEPPFEPDFFGYIYQRLVILGIKAVDWPKVLQNLKTTLKPGGWIELTEISYCRWGSIGPTTKLSNDISLKMMRSAGLDPDLGSNLTKLLSEAGFVNIKSRSIDMPVNHSDKMGEIFWENAKEALKSLKPVYTKINPELLEPGAFEKFIEDCGNECKSNKTTVPWTRAIAQKPLTGIV